MLKGYFIVCSLIVITIQSGFTQGYDKLSEPEQNFETFWHFFNDNYAFFDEKEINWEETYRTYRDKVDSTLTEKELIDVFIQMVDPIDDGHIYILRNKDFLYGRESTSLFAKEFKNDSLINQFWLNSDNTLLNQGFDSIIGVGNIFENQHLLYYSKKEDIGYLRISRFFVHFEGLFDGKSVVDIPEFLGLADSIMNNYLLDTEGLIIDLRVNPGGHGGPELAGRFTNEKIPICLKTERIDGKYSDHDTLYLEPQNVYSYNKPIILLVNDETVSSAEKFTLGMSALDNVILVGTNTEGSFSSTHDKELTNGLWFTLSNQKYYNMNMDLLEEVGVPVDYKIQNKIEELEVGVDNVIKKASELLQNGN